MLVGCALEESIICVDISKNNLEKLSSMVYTPIIVDVECSTTIISRVVCGPHEPSMDHPLATPILAGPPHKQRQI
jgi:hypothetical protein